MANLDRQIAQIDNAVAAIQRGKINAAMQLAAGHKRNRTDLATNREHASTSLASSRPRRRALSGKGAGEGDGGRPCVTPVRRDIARRRRSRRPPLVHLGGRGALLDLAATR